jgi:hypothetical protein
MNRKIVVAATLSLIGGALNFFVSLIRLPGFPWVLTNISGLMTIFAAIFLCLDPDDNRLWGGLLLLYSNIGFIAFGLSNETQLLPWGFTTFTLTTIGAALAVSQKKNKPV